MPSLPHLCPHLDTVNSLDITPFRPLTVFQCYHLEPQTFDLYLLSLVYVHGVGFETVSDRAGTIAIYADDILVLLEEPTRI